MKTERRHELQTNELADSLARWIEIARPYSRAGLALVVAVAVVLFAWGYLHSSNSRRLGDGWNEYFEAMKTRDRRGALSDIAENYAGTPVAEWARLVLADIQLEDGTQRMFLDKKDGRDELRQAADKFLSVIHESDQPMIQQHATFGLARAHEALGSLDKAREEYNSIASKWPDSPYVSDAQQRAKDLDQHATKSFYDWFAKYEPPRPLAREPGTPGVKPNFAKDPLEGAGLVLPSLNDKSSQGDSAPPSGEPAAPDSQPPADSEKPDDKPADDTAAQPADSAPQASPSK